MVKAGSDTLYLLLEERKPKRVQQIYFRIALDDVYHEYWVEGGGYLTEDNKLWVPSWAVVRERIFPKQPQFYHDNINKDECKYITKGEVASSLAKFIPFEAIPPWPNTFDEQESWEKEDKFFLFFQHFRSVQTVSYRTDSDDWKDCPIDEAHSIDHKKFFLYE